MVLGLIPVHTPSILTSVTRRYACASCYNRIKELCGPPLCVDPGEPIRLRIAGLSELPRARHCSRLRRLCSGVTSMQVVAEYDGNAISPDTLAAVTAAKAIGGSVSF